MPFLAEETVCRAATDAFAEAIRREHDPWRQARLLAFVRKRREHEGLRKLAGELVHQPETYWGALEILTEPTPKPPKEGPLWIEPVSDVCFIRIGSKGEQRDVPSGSASSHLGQSARDDPDHWLGRYPVTNGEFRRFRKPDSSGHWKDPRFNAPEQPVVEVSWNDVAMGYVQWLNNHKRAGGTFRLPSEMEWEHACRAGTGSNFRGGDNGRNLEALGWFEEKMEKGGSHPVGTKRPNRWGLCDMHGNVWEWCQAPDSKESRMKTPTGCPPSLRQPLRGGSWVNTAEKCRSASRSEATLESKDRFIGFRLLFLGNYSAQKCGFRKNNHLYYGNYRLGCASCLLNALLVNN